MPEAYSKLAVHGLTKIFGLDPEAGLARLQEGAGRAELRAQGLVVAVEDVSFDVAEGETFVVMGLSGSGKSTLIRCINRLIAPTAGRVLVEDEDVLGVDEEALRRIRLRKFGMVFQHFALFPHKSVVENVEYGLKVRGMEPQARREKALEWLDAVGLADWAEQHPDELSGGMKQRVGLARALAVEPDVLMMDEPFSALDPLIRREMQDELLELQRRFRKSVVFITHDLHEALKLGDRIAIMKEGRFVQIGSPQDIVDRPADDYVAAFTRDVDRSRVITVRSVLRKAHGLPRDEADIAALRARLDEGDLDGVHLLAEDGRPVALAPRESLARAAEGSRLEDVLHEDFPEARETAHLDALFELAAEGLPIAVTDEDGRYIGMVRPLDVFAEMSGPDTARRAGSVGSGREGARS